MTESPEQTATPQADSTGRGDELVAATVVLALFSFAGLAAVGVLLFAFIAWKLIWTKCLSGLAAPLILWLRKDVRRTLRRGSRYDG